MSSSRTRESSLWNWLNDHKPALGCVMRRVEDVLQRGTPDVPLAIYKGQTFVLELKSVPRRPRADVWCELTSDQASFLRLWQRSGGAAFVLVQVGVAAAARRYLVAADDCHELLRPISEDTLYGRSKLQTDNPTAEDVIECCIR